MTGHPRLGDKSDSTKGYLCLSPYPHGLCRVCFTSFTCLWSDLLLRLRESYFSLSALGSGKSFLSEQSGSDICFYWHLLANSGITGKYTAIPSTACCVQPRVLGNNSTPLGNEGPWVGSGEVGGWEKERERELELVWKMKNILIKKRKPRAGNTATNSKCGIIATWKVFS